MSRYLWIAPALYHRVAPHRSRATARWRVTPDQLEEQLAYLGEQGYRFLSLEQWQAAMARRRPLERRSVCVTFDDGYADFAEYAYGSVDRRVELMAWRAGYQVAVTMATRCSRLGDRPLALPRIEVSNRTSVDELAEAIA